MEGPNVYVVIAGEACAFDTRGEIVIADVVDGSPQWGQEHSLADSRGAGGPAGYKDLRSSLELAERNAKLAGIEPVRVAVE